MHPVNPFKSGNASHFIILLCLMPDDFTRQGESAATHWVNHSNPILIFPLTDSIEYDVFFQLIYQ
jgi:hypothetical protein